MKYLIFFLILTSSLCFSQENIFDRLTALDNNNKIWYNIDGYSITSETFNNSFDEKGLKKVFKKHNISETDTKSKEPKVNYNNLFITKKQKVIGDIYQTDNFYFVENSNKTTTVIWFIKNGKTDKDTEVELVNKIMENNIPIEVFVPMQINSINFVGRKIEFGNSCYWTALNTIQCPYFGAMNWSIHKTLQDAQESIDNQLNVTKSRNGGKVVSEEFVSVDFEGVTTKAKKVVFQLSGVTSVLAGMSGGKSLVIYYVAENVRNKNISCVMSFWNNDQINPETKLTPLLEKLMKLK